MLQEAGWFEGRDVFSQLIFPPDFERLSAADNVLREFGGLKVGRRGRGIDCGRCEFEIDPLLAGHLSADCAAISEKIGLKLYPLGECDHGHAFLFIDERCGIYSWFGEFLKLADSFDDAVDRMLLGKKPLGSVRSI